MYHVCTKCHSKNLKCLQTEVDKIKYLCLDCDNIFETQPTREQIDEFNG